MEADLQMATKLTTARVTEKDLFTMYYNFHVQKLPNQIFFGFTQDCAI